MYKVIIVEDESIIRKGLIYTVDWASMDCLIAGEAVDGQEGLRLMLEKRPEIVITDIRMPHVDGLKMLEEAAKVYEFFSIVLTGYSQFEYAQSAMRLNAVDYLLKPIDERKLAAALAKAKQAVERMRSARQWEMHSSLNREREIVIEALPENVENFYVRKTLMMVHDRYAQRLSLHGAACELGVSESYLARKFKEETCLTFLDYLNQYRLNKAINLMHAGGLRIGEISEKVGFSQYKQFSVIFRRYVGMSPTEFLRLGSSPPQADG